MGLLFIPSVILLSICAVLVVPFVILIGPFIQILGLVDKLDGFETDVVEDDLMLIPPESTWGRNNRITAAMATVSHCNDHHIEVSCSSSTGNHHYSGDDYSSYCLYSVLSFLFLLF